MSQITYGVIVLSVGVGYISKKWSDSLNGNPSVLINQ